MFLLRASHLSANIFCEANDQLIISCYKVSDLLPDMSLHYGDTGVTPPPPRGVSSTTTTSTTSTHSTTTASTTLMGTGYSLVSPAVSLNFSSEPFSSTVNAPLSSQSVAFPSKSSISSGSVVPSTTDLTNQILSIVSRVISSHFSSPGVPTHQSAASYIPETFSGVSPTTSLLPPQLPVMSAPAPEENLQPALLNPALTADPHAASAALPSLSSLPHDRGVFLSTDASQARAFVPHQGRVPTKDQGPGGH